MFCVFCVGVAEAALWANAGWLVTVRQEKNKLVAKIIHTHLSCAILCLDFDPNALEKFGWQDTSRGYQDGIVLNYA